MITDMHSFDAICQSGSNMLLARCTPDQLESFKKTLKFNNGRVAHADYSMLKDDFDRKELIQLFEQMGLPESRFDIIEDTSCVSRICFVHPHAFCDPDNCEHI